MRTKSIIYAAVFLLAGSTLAMAENPAMFVASPPTSAQYNLTAKAPAPAPTVNKPTATSQPRVSKPLSAPAVTSVPSPATKSSAITRPNVTSGRVTVISPNGGEIWYDQQTVKITWRTEGPMPQLYKVFLSTDGGLTFPIVVNSKVPGNQPQVEWTVIVKDQSPVKTARIRVVAEYSGRSPLSDTSDRDFEILPVPATAPHGAPDQR